MSPSVVRNPGPRDAYARFQEILLGGAPEIADELYADDVIIEFPFARPGMAKRFEGRESFKAFVSAQGAALPVRFEEFRNVVIHDTADPEVIVVEYDLAGTVTTTGQRGSQSFLLVLRVRGGRIVHLREYQNVLGMAAALGQLPALLASIRPESVNP
ncbi:nuclear transport factor 2 family protein [Parafrankia sp. EUN1f]|uniref:nuclear transport factor 2 family protein n=1 Tax=Parafrankia sp. EUN1f TaxID=102897 RepID=UPI0001C4676E|nr:nuclear transport factor 2 family protein [Parafrankia sp. EUN1f]EFC82162.1 protein of unknown function DUF1486 [Parafrankia sp. EUN1f]